MEKNILQTIKLEISKNFKLIPYERIAFHKILAILRTENGMNVLVRDLAGDPLVRESAIAALRDFENPAVAAALAPLLDADTSMAEKITILDHIERRGSVGHAGEMIAFIEAHRADQKLAPAVLKAFDVLRAVGGDDDGVYDFFLRTARDAEGDIALRRAAVLGLSSFRRALVYEELLKENAPGVAQAVYQSIARYCENFARSAAEDSEDEQLFTYSSEKEDGSILNIRVLLSKMTPQFDEYSDETKVAFLDAMIACAHREFLIYIMKALTSRNRALVIMALHLVRARVHRLADPDKLFRNLIALSVESAIENAVIVEIFQRFFTGMQENRKNLLLRDKLFNYIVVTLETYFETYRKEFMVAEVAEKDFPENFRRIRHFILERFTPELRRALIAYLKNEDRTGIHKIIVAIAGSLPHVSAEEGETVEFLVEVLFDNDPKAREVSAGRIESVNFEKKFLRDRIVRLLRIIGILDIENAATALVKMFNYVKKYPDPEILNEVGETLSYLKYSYMLGELEVALATENTVEQRRSIQLLAQFSDQRSLNIMTDFIKDKIAQSSPLTASILNILLTRDLRGNVAAGHIFRKIIEENTDAEIRRLAIQCLGKCGNESDIDFLNGIFYTLGPGDPKEAIVQAIGAITELTANFNRRQVINYLQEYLKDPGIKVRIYSCAVLILMGNKGAIKIIQDMMIIKNKQIQREILSIVGSLRSVEFAYFLISLMKEDYAISDDIVPILSLLPPEELLEIDHFIVNLFKKYEVPDSLITDRSHAAGTAEEKALFKRVESQAVTILRVSIRGFSELAGRLKLADLIMLHTVLNAYAIAPIQAGRGVVSRMCEGIVVAYFPDPLAASSAAMTILSNLREFNRNQSLHNAIAIEAQLMTDTAKIIQGEVLSASAYRIESMTTAGLANRILFDEATGRAIENAFHAERMPGDIFSARGSIGAFYELVSPRNFLDAAESMIQKLQKIEQSRQELQMQIDLELKKHKQEQRSPTAIAYAQMLDGFGKILKSELEEVNKYVQKRSLDRDLIGTVGKMLQNIHKRYIVETSKIVIK